MNIINGLLHSANQSKIASDALAAIQDGSNALTPSIAQGNKGAGLSLQMLRIEDLPRLKLATSANAEFGKSTAKLKVGEKLESLVGDLGQGQTILTNSLNTMVGALNILDLSQPGVRIGAINAVQGFLDSVASYEQNLTSIQSGIDTDIKDTVNSINTVLVELSSINRKIHGTESDHTLKDRRDELLQELSNKIGIQYSISPDSGRVEISTNFNEHRGFSLLTDSRCARLGYSSGMLTLDLISLSGGASEAQYNINLDGISVKGELEGWISARDGMIESHKSNIKQTMEQIVGRINDMHNLGATYNIRPTITSEKSILATDIVKGTGSFFAQVVDVTGHAIKGTSGKAIRPLNIDVTGELPIPAIVEEINREAECSTKASIGLGAGLHNNAGDYLIDHVSLVPKNNIGPDGNLGFALRLSSGGSVDVKFKILGISVNNGAGVDGAVVSNPLTEYIDVKAGTTMKTARDIVVNIPAGADHANIFLNMQVIGADGTFQNARARFTIGAAAGPVLTTIDIQNSRVMASDPAIVGAAGVNETWPVALAAVPDAPYLAAELNGGPYMSAAIVDGKLVMNSRGVDTGLLFVNNNASLLDSNAPSNAMPSSFAGYFGMNDLVVQSGGSYMIRPDIAANPDLLALATPNLMPASSHVITAGLDKAHAEFTLPRQPLAGNTITVNGFQFTFGVALGNIAIGADVPGTIQNIVTFLSAQNDPKIKDLIEFSVDVGNANRMVARAKFAGTAGNAITIASAIDDGFGGQENDWANGAGAGAALFDRGTNNANLGAKTMSDYVYFVAQNGLGTFDEILASSLNFVGKDGLIITTSISKYFEYEVTLPIAAEISAAKQGQETDKKLVEKTKQLLDASTKKSQEEIYMEIVKLMQNMQYAHNLVFMLLRQNQQVLDMLLRG